MKVKHYVALLLLTVLSSCGNEDEPKIIDDKSNWTVVYTEFLWSDPSWVNYQNNSNECSEWKAAHKNFLINHTRDNIISQEAWTWEVNYTNKTEQEVIDAIKTFVNFTTINSTMSSSKDSNVRYGSDKFEATLINADKSRYAVYRNKSSLYKNSASSFRYDITYGELRVISNGEYLPEPLLLEDWSNSHQLTNCTETNNYRSRVWHEETNELSLDFIKTKVEPFVSWSIGNTELPSYHLLTVRIHDYKEDITITYKSTPNGMN